MVEQTRLKRVISLPLLVFYGAGTILGAGIYALIGKIAGLSGLYAPFSFLMSALIAAFVAFTYAELSSHYPKSAGEAVYVSQAFNRQWLTALVGWGIVFTGVVSSGVMARGFCGYLSQFIAVSEAMAITLFVLMNSLIAIAGISLSVGFAALITLVEISGILLILFVSRAHLLTLMDHWQMLLPPLAWQEWRNIVFGAFLAFYAFIGFEDMVNIAEEVIEPEKNLPKGIIWALLIATLFYVLVSLAAVLSLPINELAEHKAPFALIIQRNSNIPVQWISLISLVAILNGALVQMVMGSRVLYGMAEKGVAPRYFGQVHAKTGTPIVATLFFTALLLMMALWLPIEVLARATSFVILSIFALVSLSLCVIKGRHHVAAGCAAEIRLPYWVPLISLLICLLFIGLQFF